MKFEIGYKAEFYNISANIDFYFETKENGKTKTNIISFQFKDFCLMFYENKTLSFEFKETFAIKDFYNLLMLVNESLIKVLNADNFVLDYETFMDTEKIYFEIY